MVSADWSNFCKLVEVVMQVERSLTETERENLKGKRSSSAISEEGEKGNVEDFNKRSKSAFSQGSRWSGDLRQKCTECGKRHSRGLYAKKHCLFQVWNRRAL